MEERGKNDRVKVREDTRTAGRKRAEKSGVRERREERRKAKLEGEEK